MNLHHIKLNCRISHVGDNFAPLIISDNFIFSINKCRRILFSDFRKSRYDFFSTKFVELVGGFSPINSQSTKSRSYLLGIDRRTILLGIFCTLTKFRKSFELPNKSDTIFLFSNFSEFFKMFSNKRKISTIQQQTRSLVCLPYRITCFSRTFRIAINTLEYKFTELFLSISQKLFFSHKNTIVFLPYFYNIKTKNNVLTSLVNKYKCNKCNQSVTSYSIADKSLNTIYTFIHLLHLYLKKNNFKNNMGRTLCNIFFS